MHRCQQVETANRQINFVEGPAKEIKAEEVLKGMGERVYAFFNKNDKFQAAF
jgi:hypothetical protein